MAVPKPIPTEFGIHYRLESCGCVWLELLAVVFFVRVKVVFKATGSVVTASASWFPFREVVEFAKGKKVLSLVLLALVVLTSSPEHRVHVKSKRAEKFIVFLLISNPFLKVQL